MPARQRKGIDVGRIDHLEAVGNIAAMALARQLLANTLHIGLQLGVFDHAHLLGDLLAGLLPQRHFLRL